MNVTRGIKLTKRNPIFWKINKKEAQILFLTEQFLYFIKAKKLNLKLKWSGIRLMLSLWDREKLKSLLKWSQLANLL
jgi:hypothetical protein